MITLNNYNTQLKYLTFTVPTIRLPSSLTNRLGVL